MQNFNYIRIINFMKRTLFFVFASVVFASCQKEVEGDAGNSGGSGGGGGNNTSTDYQPVSANSEWNYSSTSAGNYTLKALGTDTTINAKRYYEFDNSSPQGAERVYIGKSNGIYWQYGESAVGGIILEQVYLKDSAIGTNWTNTISVGGFNNYHKYTVSARDIQRTVSGKTFNTVIELTYQMSVDDPLGGGILSVGGGKQYYAKGVGPIESYFKVGFLGVNVSDTTKLVSYTIR
jgi:hypothetical protein